MCHQIPVLQQLSEDKEVSLDILPLVVALAFGACLGGQYTHLLSASTLTSCLGGQSVHSHLHWEVSQYTHILSGRSVSTLTSSLGNQSVHSHPVWEVSRYTNVLSVSTLTSCLGG